MSDAKLRNVLLERIKRGPPWPPRPTVLTAPRDVRDAYSKHPDLRSREDWRRWAEFLEAAGLKLVEELEALRNPIAKKRGRPAGKAKTTLERANRVRASALARKDRAEAHAELKVVIDRAVAVNGTKRLVELRKFVAAKYPPALNAGREAARMKLIEKEARRFNSRFAELEKPRKRPKK